MLTVAAATVTAGAAMSEGPQEVDVMLTILLDTFWNATTETCDAQTTHAEALIAALQNALDGEDTIPRNGSIALGVYFYGGKLNTGGDPDVCDYVTEAFPITHITSETEITLQGSPLAGFPWLHSAMTCVGDHVDAAESNDFDAAKRVMVIIPHGQHADLDPALARDDLLSGLDPTVHEIHGLACTVNYDPTHEPWEDAETYLLDHVIGDVSTSPWGYLLPYEVGEGDYAVTATHFYATPSEPCDDDGTSILKFELQVKILTRVLLSRCLYDVAGVRYYPDPNDEEVWFEYGDGMVGQGELGLVLANYEEDPFNPLADLDKDDDVDQQDLGIILANFGCGSRFAE